MTAFKAIRITKSNKNELEAKYGMAEKFLEFSSGLFIVSEFGDTQYKSILTKAGLEANYTVGKDLKNGFFEITKKSLPNTAVTV